MCAMFYHVLVLLQYTVQWGEIISNWEGIRCLFYAAEFQ